MYSVQWRLRQYRCIRLASAVNKSEHEDITGTGYCNSAGAVGNAIQFSAGPLVH